MYDSEKINFVNGRQYKSISNIEKLHSNSIMKDLDYQCSLNLQTKSRLSNTINIYLSINELIEVLVNPIKELLERKNASNPVVIEKETKNFITKKVLSHYDLFNILPDGYNRDKIKNFGCVEYMKFKYTIEDKRFIKIEMETAYRWFIIKYKPKNIQPKTILLSLDEAEDLLLMINNTFNID